MNLVDLALISRTCRRFKGSAPLSEEILSQLVNVTRYAPSARNLQPLRYVLVSSEEAREAVFGAITLGGALTPEQRATPEQHPGGYIIIFGPADLGTFGIMDVGIAAQTINLAANDRDLACCMVGAFNKPRIKEMTAAHTALEPYLVLALGEPDETLKITDVPTDGNTTYFRDDEDTHCVPKRPLAELIVGTL